MKILHPEILVSVQKFGVPIAPAFSDHRQQIVFLHDSQHSFRVFMDAVPLKSDVYVMISVGLASLILTFSDLLSQCKILRTYIPFYIVAASGHLEESAHFADSIFIFMTIDCHVLDLCSHFLPVSERKSRISYFPALIALSEHPCAPAYTADRQAYPLRSLQPPLTVCLSS